jgi:hypothetical protein
MGKTIELDSVIWQDRRNCTLNVVSSESFHRCTSARVKRQPATDGKNCPSHLSTTRRQYGADGDIWGFWQSLNGRLLRKSREGLRQRSSAETNGKRSRCKKGKSRLEDLWKLPSEDLPNSQEQSQSDSSTALLASAEVTHRQCGLIPGAEEGEPDAGFCTPGSARQWESPIA